MQVVTPQIIKNKKVLLRYDIDVALRQVTKDRWQVTEDFKLKAGIGTLKLCLENASKVIVIGHVGRPFATTPDEKKGNPSELSAKPIYEWFKKEVDPNIEFAKTLEEAGNSKAKLVLLENIRFFHGEVEGDVDFAKQLAGLGEIYINEAFSSHNKAASTTIVPTILPHFAGLHFIKEVATLLEVRNNPKKPFVAIMGGAKVKDKLPVICQLAKNADAVLVGGKLIAEIREQKVDLPSNVMVGSLNQDGFDISAETASSWEGLISKAAMIVWNGPLGKFEDPKYDQSAKVAKLVEVSGAQIVIGGGDTVAFLGGLGLLRKFEEIGFVSVGGGAMLKLLSDGTLITIEALG